MKKHFSKLLTLVLALALVLSCVTAIASAATAGELVATATEDFDDEAYVTGKGGGRTAFFNVTYPTLSGTDKYVKFASTNKDRSSMASDYADMKTGNLSFTYQDVGGIPDYVAVDFFVKSESAYPAETSLYLSARTSSNGGATCYAIYIAKSGDEWILSNKAKGGSNLGSLGTDANVWQHVTLIYDMDASDVTKSAMYIYVNGTRTATVESGAFNANCYLFDGFRTKLIDKTTGSVDICLNNFQYRYVSTDAQYGAGSIDEVVKNPEANLTAWTSWGYTADGGNQGTETPDTPDEPDTPDTPPVATPLFKVGDTEYTTLEELTAIINGTTDAEITLLKDVEVPGNTWTGIKANIVINLNGKTIRQSTATNPMFTPARSGASLTVKNGSIVRGDASLAVNSQQMLNITQDYDFTFKAQGIRFTTNAMFMQARGGDNGTLLDFENCEFNILANKNLFTGKISAGKKLTLNLTGCTLNNSKGLTAFTISPGSEAGIYNINVDGGTYNATTFINMTSTSSESSVNISNASIYATTPFAGIGSLFKVADGVKLSTLPTLEGVVLGDGDSVYVDNTGADAAALPYIVGELPLEVLANLTLYSSLNVNLFIPTDAGVTAVAGTDVTTLPTDTVNGKTYYVYTISGIAAAKACDTYTVEITTSTATVTKSISILDYAKTVLGTDTAECNAAEQLIVDLLAYMRASYAYFASADTDSIQAIDEALEGYTPTAYAATELDKNTVTDVNSIYDVISSAYLDLSDETPAFAFYVEALDFAEIELTAGGKTLVKGTYTYGDIITVDMRAFDLREVITITANDGMSDYVGTYSLYTYLTAVENGEVTDPTDGKLLPLTQALYTFSVTAEEYKER